jgi:nicotinamidase-related amidase
VDSSAALIIIDMQNEFCINEDQSIKEHCLSIIENINKVAFDFRSKNLNVIWLNWGVDKGLTGMSPFQKEKFNNFQYPASMEWKRQLNSSMNILQEGSWSAQIVTELEVDPSDVLISKKRMSGFWFTNLDTVLKGLKIKNLYFAGINTDQCVLATLQDAHFAGYGCTLLEDCSTTSSPNYCLEASLYNIKNCFGKIVNSEQLKELKVL